LWQQQTTGWVFSDSSPGLERLTCAIRSTLFLARAGVGDRQLLAGEGGEEARKFVEVGEGDAEVAPASVFVDADLIVAEEAAQLLLRTSQVGTLPTATASG